MTPSFSSYLVNDCFGDPGVYVEVRWSKRALLFDLGQNDSLGSTRLLRASDLFVSHTHMDHFIGFDAVVRVALGRGKTLRLYGPPGVIENVEGKLRGYTWNLVDGYPLGIEVREFDGHEAALPVGGWLKDVKQYLWEGKPDDFRFTAVLFDEHRRVERQFVLGDVATRFLTITKGQKLAYVVDARYDDDNEAKIVALAKHADVLY